MYVVGSFKQNLFVELVISELQELGISQNQILALPLEKRNERPKLFDNMQYADGESFVGPALTLGTIGMLLGSIYGFVLPWGPVLWALFGLVIGSCLGFLIKYILVKRKHDKLLYSRVGESTEVFLMIHSEADKSKQMEYILWTHHALGVGTLD